MNGTELKQLRLRLSLTQAQLGLLCYVDGVTVWRWEHGTHPVPPLVAEKVVGLVSTLPSELVAKT